MSVSKITTVGFIGECMVELKRNSKMQISQSFSGDTLNSAIFFNRAINRTSIKTEYITAVGRDSFSEEMLQFWSNEGLICDSVLRLEEKIPGLYFIHVDNNGERSFTYWRGDSAAKYMFSSAGSENLLARIEKLDAVYLSGISLAILTDSGRNRLLSALRALKDNNGKLFFDNNYRSRLWSNVEMAKTVYNDIMNLCDMAFLTLEDEAELFETDTVDEVFNRCNGFNIPEIIVKCGAEDCWIKFEGEKFSVAAERVETVVDTTAAGDSFSAAYLVARMQLHSPCDAARAGHKLAAQVIQTEGVF